MMKKLVLWVFVFILSLCFVQPLRADTEPVGNNKLSVVATIFPLYDFVRQVGKEYVDVRLLLSPGIEIHAFSLRPQDFITIKHADVFFYTDRDIEYWVETVRENIDEDQTLVVEVAKGLVGIHGDAPVVKDDHGHGHAHDGHDPHVWLDFDYAAQMVARIAEALSAQDPARTQIYQKNAQDYMDELKILDQTYRDALARSVHRTVISGGHRTFGLLTSRYGLNYMTAYKNFSPDAEPMPRDIARMIQLLKEHQVSYIYYDELLEPNVARTIAHETGAELLLLHGVHNVSLDEFKSGATYLSIMRENLERLKLGLGVQ